ncbi:fructokinase [Ligilactobacillus salitolerans]|uniref:fructokinase n=1 Tax=Ligilactobacillus salitolerans TaxID=1808352 RepID=A0A401IRC0_9LACO|nr:ROK family protein [Ligilactobacillus salitolerans]GBG94078.1 fructokinase [Ligilactobacillus salitolerans]
MRLGSIEAGGTKFIVAVADENYRILARRRIPTTTPAETLAACISFFQENPVNALGIGSFGPAEIKRDSPHFGTILNTPKPNWAQVDVVGPLKQALQVPAAFTTDVNASAYGEYMLGAGKKVNSLIYFTVGTGIGGGAIQDGHFIGGRSHTEMGHAFVKPYSGDDFKGVCPYHGNQCFEGMASGPAIEARTGQRGEDLERSADVFKLISYYTAQLVLAAYLNFTPEKIVLGGSVISQTELPQIRKVVRELNNGYVDLPDLDQLLVLTSIPDNGAATMGNFALARRLLEG